MTATPPAGDPDRRALVGLGALLLGGLALRIPGLLDRPLWLDEAVQVGVATAPDLRHALVNDDLHPPLLALLLRGWLAVSHHPGWVRLPSFLASLATIPLAYLAAARWNPRDPVRAGLAAATWTVVLPPLVVYASEARPYALVGMWAMALVALVPRGQLLTATVVAVLASATHYGAWPLAWCALVLAGRGHAAPARVTASLVLAAVQTALIAGLVVPQRAGPGAGLTEGSLAPWFGASEGSWVWRGPLGALGWFVTGRAGTVGLVAGVLLAVVLVGLVATARTPRRLGLLVGVPAAMLAGGALAGVYPLGATRHALVLLPPLVVWVAVATATARATWSAPVLAAVMFATTLSPRPPVQRVAAAIGDRRPVVADGSASPIVRWYGPEGALTLDWRRGPALTRALDESAPRGPFWFVWTSARPAAEADVRAWARDRSRQTGPRSDAVGATALWIGPAP